MRQDWHLSNPQVLNGFVRNMNRTAAAVALATIAAAAARLPAQSAGHSPDVGDMAPDFTLAGARAGQVLTTPVKLSDYRGKTVVLAFFFKARTSGCTHQMEAYRDRYASLFHGGQNVVLIAVSADDPKTLASWSADEKFQFVLASDAAGAAGTQYGTFDPGAKMDERTLFVIGPDGKITYRARPFRELVESAYTDLGSAVAKAGG
jgi:thioredoxin-dependent peroxiredoxin